jgi:adenylate cyclase
MLRWLLFFILWVVFLSMFMIARFWGTDDLLFGKFPITFRHGLTTIIIGCLFLSITDCILSIVASRPSISKIPYIYVLACKLMILIFIFSMAHLLLRIALYVQLSEGDREYLLNSFLSYFASTRAWSLLLSVVIFSLIINLIVKMKELIGGTILFNLLIGHYRIPRTEKRIFMFLDLKDSTAHAEHLGDAKFSKLIQDVFDDLGDIAVENSATIVKFVGDEVILSWSVKDGIRKNNCIKFYFSYMNKLASRSKYYNDSYKLVPEFKAGIHIGESTIIEIGRTRKEIAYISDTLNTTSRLEKECVIQGQKLLISSDLKEVMEYNKDAQEITFLRIGAVMFKGKKESVDVYTVKAMDL